MANPFELIGRSLVPDEHKGNYATAARLVGEAEPDHALLAQGMVELLAGAPGAARDTYERLRQLEPGPAILLPAYFLSSLASAQWGLGGIDVAGVVWQLSDSAPLWSFSGPALDHAQRWEAAVRQSSRPARGAPAPWVEAALGSPAVPGLLGVLNVRAVWSGAINPAAADCSWATDIVARNLGPDDHSGWGFLLRVKAEHAMATGDGGTARRLLDESADRYREGGDVAGAASCALLAGDWLSAPQSSPLLLGLLDQRRSSGAARWRATPSETEAEQAYGLAEQGFVGCPRGQAALALRRSYLAAHRGAADHATSLAALAADEFAACGDERGFRIAAMHLALHRLAAGIPVDAVAIAAELAGWALGRGSPSLAFHLGGLAGAWGRYLLHEQGDVLAALRCHELAGELHRALGAVVAHAQNHLAAAEAHSCAGDQQRAALSAEKAVLALTPALREDHPLMVLAAQQLPVLALHGLSVRYAPALDDEGLAAAVRRLRPLQDRLGALLAHHGRVVKAMAEHDERFPNEHRLASENLAFAMRVAPVLDYVLEQSAEQVPWLEAVRLLKEGAWSQARQKLTALLAHCRAGARDPLRAKVLRELEPYALLALRRRREAAAAFDATAGGFGVLSLVEVTAPVEGPGYDSPETRRFQAALQRVTFLTTAQAFGRAAEVIRELEALRGKEWWRYGPEPWSWLGRLADVAQGTGRLAEAAEWYGLAIDALESRRFGASRDSWQASYYGSPNAALIYVAASRCALRRGRAEQALELSERGRARATADLLATGSRDASIEAWRTADARSTVRHNQLHQARVQPEPDQNRLSELARLAAEADRELAERERALPPRLLMPAVRRRDPDLAARIAGALPDGTALVSYRLHDDGLLVWAVTRAGIVVAEELALDVNTFVERVRLMHDACTRTTDDWREHAAHLGEALLAPVATVLREHRRLLVVPSGPLHGLPFPVLSLAGRPLVTSHEVSLLPAAFLATERTPRPRHPESLTAFGDPGNPTALPWARREVEQITKDGGTAAVGTAVTKQAVLAALRRPGVVHIASHGTFDSATPLNSGLLLANDETLTVADLVGARIRAGLVVLTACSTGRGAVTHGEDVIGLPRGFLVGGATTVVAPLWDVRDAPTARLAAALHLRLRTGESVPSALRNAQNDMREGKFGSAARHPHYWASLISMGNPHDTVPRKGAAQSYTTRHSR